MSRLVLAAILPAALAAGVMAWLFLGLGALAQALLSAALIPDADLLLHMTVAALGTSLSLAIPVGTLVGVGGGIRRLREEGAVLAAATLGAGRGHIVIPVSFVVILAAFAWAASLHFGEPGSRALMRDSRIAAAVRVRPTEGATLEVGPWYVAIEDGILRFAGQGVVGSANEWSVAPARTGVVATLADVSARALDGSGGGTASRLVVPLPLAGTRGKISFAERTTPDVLGVIDVNARLGRGAYERWMLWKRTLLPMVLVALGLAIAGMSLRGRPVGITVSMQAFAIWGAVRVADQSITVLGAPWAAAGVLAVSFGFVADGWLAWPASLKGRRGRR